MKMNNLQGYITRMNLTDDTSGQDRCKREWYNSTSKKFTKRLNTSMLIQVKIKEEAW